MFKNSVTLEGKVKIWNPLSTSASGSYLNFDLSFSNGKDKGFSSFKCIAFKETAEEISQLDGQRIIIEGNIKQESWIDKRTNEKKTGVKIFVNGYQNTTQAILNNASQMRQAVKPAQQSFDEFNDDTIPF